MIGYMQPPADFKYFDVVSHGKPVHAINDSFAVKHPAMDLSKRAKIFSPFDALKGFTEAVEAKDELYVERVELSEDECAELDRVIGALRELVCNGSAVRENNVTVTVTHFVPCTDTENDAYGYRGQYVETKGVLTEINIIKRLITVDGRKILLGVEDSETVKAIMTKAEKLGFVDAPRISQYKEFLNKHLFLCFVGFIYCYKRKYRSSDCSEYPL